LVIHDIVSNNFIYLNRSIPIKPRDNKRDEKEFFGLSGKSSKHNLQIYHRRKSQDNETTDEPVNQFILIYRSTVEDAVRR
jgi:hypothetical protein